MRQREINVTLPTFPFQRVFFTHLEMLLLNKSLSLLCPATPSKRFVFAGIFRRICVCGDMFELSIFPPSKLKILLCNLETVGVQYE